VLTRATLERLASRSPSGEPPLVVDMAVPPDVLPEDAAAAGLARIGMDDVIREAEQNRRERMMELGEARALVDEALAGLRRRLADRLMSPLIATLQKRYQRTALEGVERLFRKELGGLGDGERAAVTRWAETLARRFAHIPSVGLRSLAEELGSGAVEAFLCGLEDELARELRGAAAGSNGMAVPTEEDAQ
jgi:glutamyl-tRNA reductase